MRDILETITEYRERKGWTEYQLSLHSGLPQSTISSWYRKNILPTVPSLEKICKALDITMSQLFAEDGAPVSLTPAQAELLNCWAKLNDEQKAAVLHLIDTM